MMYKDDYKGMMPMMHEDDDEDHAYKGMMHMRNPKSARDLARMSTQARSYYGKCCDAAKRNPSKMMNY